MSMHNARLVPAVLGALTLGVSSAAGAETFTAKLTGTEEVPVQSTPATGTFRAEIDATGTTIQYELTYQGLVGTPTVAHIHVGQRNANGGISIFLCSTTPPPPPAVQPPTGTPACPVPPATVTGTILANQVLGPTAQQVQPGELAEVIAAIREGLTYANVHSNLAPAGEIRGQLRREGRRDHSDK